MERGSRVTWKRPGMTDGAGMVEKTVPAHADRTMHMVRDDRGNVFWFSEDVLAEAHT